RALVVGSGALEDRIATYRFKIGADSTERRAVDRAEEERGAIRRVDDRVVTDEVERRYESGRPRDPRGPRRVDRRARDPIPDLVRDVAAAHSLAHAPSQAPGG